MVWLLHEDRGELLVELEQLQHVDLERVVPHVVELDEDGVEALHQALARARLHTRAAMHGARRWRGGGGAVVSRTPAWQEVRRCRAARVAARTCTSLSMKRSNASTYSTGRIAVWSYMAPPGPPRSACARRGASLEWRVGGEANFFVFSNPGGQAEHWRPRTGSWSAMAMAPALAPAGGVPAAQADVAPPGSDGGLSCGGVQLVALNAAGIVFADALVAQEDVAGLEDAGGSLLRVHAYPLREGACRGGSVRRHVTCDLDFAAAPEAKRAWMLQHKHLWGRHRLQRVLVILNPFSGGKRGLHVWHSVVEGMLMQAGVQAELLKTTHAGHAVEIARHADLARLDGVVAIGGDGVLSEVVACLACCLRKALADALGPPCSVWCSRTLPAL